MDDFSATDGLQTAAPRQYQTDKLHMLGDRNWWFPAWLGRVIPRLHVEAGTDVDAELARLTEGQRATIPGDRHRRGLPGSWLPVRRSEP